MRHESTRNLCIGPPLWSVAPAQCDLRQFLLKIRVPGTVPGTSPERSRNGFGNGARHGWDRHAPRNAVSCPGTFPARTRECLRERCFSVSSKIAFPDLFPTRSPERQRAVRGPASFSDLPIPGTGPGTVPGALPARSRHVPGALPTRVPARSRRAPGTGPAAPGI